MVSGGGTSGFHRQIVRISSLFRFRSVVVITFASHAKGPRFETGRKQAASLFPLGMCLLIGKTNRCERHGVRQGTQLEEELVTTWKSLYSALGEAQEPRQDLEVDGFAHHPPLITEPDDKENRGSQREQDLGSAARSATARPGGTQSATLCPCPRAKATPRKGDVKGDEQRGHGWEPCTAAHSPGPLRHCLSRFLTF